MIPIIEGSEVNDDPFAPISKFARERIAECGDATAIGWLHRDNRYVEKLATPDVTIADIIGDVDPIKAARGGHMLADELTMHFGLLPRANRGIFAINELPDLSGKVQVGLFNIMQEGDVQIKGYPVRLPLDVLLAFTANPEDYTARGKIITPLKDRIGSEIPPTTPSRSSWGWRSPRRRHGPSAAAPLDSRFVRETVERVAFEAREDKRVDKRSGVSQRLPISVLEHAISNAERRSLTHSGRAWTPGKRLYASVPSITGKLELEYEGELQGGGAIARELIRRAAGDTLAERAGGRDGRHRRLVRPGRRPQDERRRAERTLSQGTSGGARMCDTVTRGRPRSAISATGGRLRADPEGLAAEKRISRNEEVGYTRAKPENGSRGWVSEGVGLRVRTAD